MKRTFFSLLVFAGIFSTSICQAEVTSSHVEYHDGGTILQGTVVKDSVGPNTRPVVVVFHDWMGPSEVTTASAEQIAKLGYIAFIADVYGKGVRPTTVPEASAQSTIYKTDRTLMRHRAELALAAATETPGVDTKKVAAIGYCFGGTVALELARDGARLNGVVSLHGGLETPDTSLAKNISTKLLVLHGADDPFVPAKEVDAFVEEMHAAKVDFNLIKYPGAVHAFTNKKADDLKLAGAKYNAEADTKSFADMSAFLAKVFS